MHDSEILLRVTEVLPTLTKAVQEIMASDAGHTIESAVVELCNHVTPGKPDSPALSQHEPAG